MVCVGVRACVRVAWCQLSAALHPKVYTELLPRLASQLHVCHGGAAPSAGAAAGISGESAAGKERMNDVHSLVLLPGSQRLCWSDCDSADLAQEDTLQGGQQNGRLLTRQA